MRMTVNNYIFNAGQARLRILAVDDTAEYLDLLKAVLTHAGHSVITATSGEEALLIYKKERPDLVLMDINMPGIGGIEATRRMRALDADRWIPIIFISALAHNDDMVRGLEAGGDDYLGKPIDIVMLLAKINAMKRIAVLEDKLHMSNAQIHAYQENSVRELNMARELMEQMMAVSSVQLPGVEQWLKPASDPGGDVLITQHFNHDLEYILLADAMGHGLSAAILLVPLVQTFTDMARAGESVPVMVKEMNSSLANFLPVGHFVAVTLLSVDRKNRLLEIWNGGNPPALLSDRSGKVTSKFKSRHPSLGVLRGKDFDASSESFNWSDERCMTLYSDGLVDAINTEGVEFGENGIIAALHGSCSHQTLKQAITEHIGEYGASDDISLATVKFK